jgi:DNA-binding beta-propeller fold protein YncE
MMGIHRIVRLAGSIALAAGFLAAATSPTAASAAARPPVTILATQIVPATCHCSGLYAVGVDSTHHWAYVAGQEGDTEAIDTKTGVRTVLDQPTETGSVAVDQATGFAYLPISADDAVAVAKGTSIVATVTLPAGSGPDDATIDPATGVVYVDDFESGQVSVIKGTALLTTLTVGGGPTGGAVDAIDGDVYIPNHGDGTVSVIRGEKVVKTLKALDGPEYVAVDPSRHLAYVSDFYGGAVTVLHGTKRVGDVTVGTNPFGIAVDPTTHLVYVGDMGGAATSVSILDGATVRKTVTVGAIPGVPAYDPSAGLVLFPSQNSAVLSILDGTKVVQRLTTTPTGNFAVGVDTSLGRAFVTGAASGSLDNGNAVTELQAPTAGKVTIKRPAHGHYKRGSKVVVRFSCRPGTNNTVTSCMGSTANRHRLPTTKVGAHHFTVTMRSGFGATIKKKVTYRVTR